MSDLGACQQSRRKRWHNAALTMREGARSCSCNVALADGECVLTRATRGFQGAPPLGPTGRGMTAWRVVEHCAQWPSYMSDRSAVGVGLRV